MAETCLSSGLLAVVIFGAIFGTLFLCALFLAAVWFWFLRNRSVKIFDRKSEKPEEKGDIEIGGLDTVDSSAPIRQKSIVLNGKSLPSDTETQSEPKVLEDLGVTISKRSDSSFEVVAVAKTDNRFVEGDRIAEVSVSLDQMRTEDAAILLELLVPYRIQMEILRNVETNIPEVQSESEMEEPEAPRPPSISPPISPTDNIAEEKEEKPKTEENPEETEKPEENKENPKEENKEEKEEIKENGEEKTPKSVRIPTKIPTPKSARGKTSPLDSVRIYDEMRSKLNGFAAAPLEVNGETTDDFGLTKDMYETLENNRRRLESERQNLRDMGILS